MNYKEALAFLDSFTDYEKIGYKNRKAFRLGRVHRLAAAFSNPEKSFLSIHIAGTKGKGSIAAFTASILKEAGFRVGLYTSPHLQDLRERIRLNGEMIAKDDFIFHAGEIKEKIRKENLKFPPTFFEVCTILAFNYFRAKKIDYAVLETGLGGRLDATNIVGGFVSVISPVSFDHMHVLGRSLDRIAFEKCGIIKTGCVTVSAPQEKDAFEVIRKKCKSLNARLISVGKEITFKERLFDSEKEVFDIRGTLEHYQDLSSRLLGRHQIINASCAVGVAEALIKKGAKISSEHMKRGIEKTENPARCEIVSRKPYLVLDGAQNRASAKALGETIKRNFDSRRLILVLGISRDKDIKGLCEELVPLADLVILTKAKADRAEEPRSIKKFITDKKVILTDSVREALRRARAAADANDMILVTGSFFVIGEAKLII